MTKFSKRAVLLSAAWLCAVSIGVACFACQVPVFRYALERWPADKYEIVVLHQQPLSQGELQLVSILGKTEADAPAAPNMTVRTVQMDSDEARPYESTWKRSSRDGKPVVVLQYPKNAQDLPNRIAHVSNLDASTCGYLCSSPAREKIANQLLDGDSAVWIFVPCGDEALDSAAFLRLEKEVLACERTLKLPPQEEIEADELFNKNSKIELRLSFSIVTLDREKAEERVLLDMLIGSEADLASFHQPMAFPVFGRGRVLYALIGDGIGEETVREAASFIIAPCSCQVKERNPGFDLLLTVDWDKHVGVIEEQAAKPTTPIQLKIPAGRSSR